LQGASLAYGRFLKCVRGGIILPCAAGSLKMCVTSTFFKQKKNTLKIFHLRWAKINNAPP
jgi:hypothetical protein